MFASLRVPSLSGFHQSGFGPGVLGAELNSFGAISNIIITLGTYVVVVVAVDVESFGILFGAEGSTPNTGIFMIIFMIN